MKPKINARHVLLCVFVLALASCTSPETPIESATGADTSTGDQTGPAEPPAPQVEPTGVIPAPADVEGTTTGGDGSPIRLEGLTPAQVEDAGLPGELACSFIDADDAVLLLARADVLPDGPVRGVVNHSGYAELLGNGRAGGFNDLADGITLSGKGLTVVLDRGEAEPTGDESTRHAATLKVQRADGAERTWSGTLACGP
ncbi:hypothetical protein [Novilysobacter erysipheiresistens]|uniref:DUF3558 domain-containing protein n=1 Tax=Novilysobacter erysipheiresistens TaxID=1749332 RepID=A0ABU7YW04_9GAMM